MFTQTQQGIDYLRQTQPGELCRHTLQQRYGFARSRAQCGRILPVLDIAYQHFFWNLELVGKLCDKFHGHLSLLDSHDGLFAAARQTESGGPRAMADESVKTPPRP